MKSFKKTNALFAVPVFVIVMLSGCAGMTPQEKSTAIGAGAGAIGGAILSGGSTAGTLGGRGQVKG